MAFTDIFTGSNGDDLSSRAGWTLLAGVANGAEVNGSNQLKVGSTTESTYTITDQGSADCFAQAECLDTDSGSMPFPVVIRLTDENNFIAARCYSSDTTDGSNEWQLYKKVAGSFTLINSFSQTFVSGDVLRLEATGDTVKVLVNAVEVISATETFNNTATGIGTISRGNLRNPWIDSFEAGTTAAGLTIDSTDSTMQRGTSFELVCSGATTAPTTGNTTLTNGNDTLTPSSVTGSDPYTLAFAVGDLTKQVDATGYDWTLEITP